MCQNCRSHFAGPPTGLLCLPSLQFHRRIIQDNVLNGSSYTIQYRDSFVSETFTVKIREKAGTSSSKALRNSDQTPAVLYGMDKGNVSIAIPTREIDSAIRHGSHLVDLKGDLNEPALIKVVQWGPLGSVVKHLDLIRVDLSKDIEVTIPLVLHGVAPGGNDGGVVTLVEHELTIACPAKSLPDHLEVNINHLELEQELLAKDVELPEGAKLLGEPDAVVVTCHEAKAAPVEETEEAAEGEPEVIGEKGEEAGGGDES